MGKKRKYNKGDLVGSQQVEMISDSWIPEGKTYNNKRAIFQCPHCENTFEASVDYVDRIHRKPNMIISCGCKLEVPRYKVGDKVGIHNMEILEVIPKVKIAPNKYEEGKFKFECRDCGRPFITHMEQITKKGRTTCGCTWKKQKLYDGDILNGFKVLEAHVGLNPHGKHLSLFECKHCGTPFTAINSLIRNGYKDSCGCTYVPSKGEVALSDFIQSLYPTDTIKRSARVLELKEIDAFIEAQNIGFEFNGLFWHSEARGKDQYYHINKIDMAKQIGVKLFHIFEHNWRYNEEITKDTLLRCLDLIKPNVKSQQCTLKSITQKEAKDFVKANSLYPYKSSEINLGLFNMNELVSLMSFQKDTNEDYLIQNVTTKIGINVELGYKTILDTFEAEYKPNNLIWLSDNSLSLDYIIKDLDFIFSKREIAKKHYFNPSNLEILTEQKIKHLMKDNTYGESEFDFLSELGYLRYWDCGNDVYIKTKGNK